MCSPCGSAPRQTPRPPPLSLPSLGVFLPRLGSACGDTGGPLSFGEGSCAGMRHISDWREQSFPIQEIYVSAAVVGAMRKAALTILRAFLITGSAVQMAAASEHRVRTGRGHHQSGRAYNDATPPELDAYGRCQLVSQAQRAAAPVGLFENNSDNMRSPFSSSGGR